MGKAKAKMQPIENRTTRKTTFRKRVRGIIKKTQELSLLCDVDVCTIIYGPRNPVPVVWPAGEEEVKWVINNYKQQQSYSSSSSGMMREYDQESFLKEKIAKAEEKLLRLQRTNRVMEMENLATDILCGKMRMDQVPCNDLGDLLWVLEDKLKGIEYRKTMISKKLANPPTMVAHDGVDGGDHGGHLAGGSGGSGGGDGDV